MADFYDIDLSFSLDSSGDIKLVEDNSAIVQSLRTIIETSTGEKPGVGYTNTQFGVGYKRYLFAPLTYFTGRSLAESIQRQISIFEPRVNIQDLRIDVNIQKRKFEIELDYTVARSGKAFTFKTVINQI